MPDEFDVSQIEFSPDKQSLFCLTGPGVLSEQQVERVVASWKGAWKSAGVDPPPVLLVLERGWKIGSVAGGTLQDVGVLRLTQD